MCSLTPKPVPRFFKAKVPRFHVPRAANRAPIVTVATSLVGTDPASLRHLHEQFEHGRGHLLDPVVEPDRPPAFVCPFIRADELGHWWRGRSERMSCLPPLHDVFHGDALCATEHTPGHLHRRPLSSRAAEHSLERGAIEALGEHGSPDHHPDFPALEPLDLRIAVARAGHDLARLARGGKHGRTGPALRERAEKDERTAPAGGFTQPCFGDGRG